jgi:hypothetical protein
MLAFLSPSRLLQRPRGLATTVPLRLLLCAGLAGASSAQELRRCFEQDVLGGPPRKFHVAQTGVSGQPATWRVEAAETTDGEHVIALATKNGGEVFNLLLSDDPHPADLVLTVSLRARAGDEDQGGGLVWRARDANNYYVARWNPLEDNVRLYKVETGTRTMFASADTRVDAKAWHRLSITMRGPAISVRLDGKEYLHWQDTTFANGGRIGFWTKADASTHFDLLEVQPPPPVLASRLVPQGPVVDGVAEDGVWRDAQRITTAARRALPPNEGSETEVELRSVHSATHIALLVRWRDETEDATAHKPWTWNASKQAYEEGAEREDMLSVGFAHTGEFQTNMLACPDSVWDVWHWKAVRTNPQGFAMDRTHRYSTTQLAGKAAEHRSPSGRSIWIARPEDAGDAVERKQPAPAAHGADVVAQFVAGTPTGSAADVQAKGAWRDGWWTLELVRRLDTGHADDTPFVRGGRTLFAVATHDRTGAMDRATGTIELELASAGK